MNKNITIKQFRALVDNPLPGFKGTKKEYRELIKSLLIPPEQGYDWCKEKDGTWTRVKV